MFNSAIRASAQIPNGIQLLTAGEIAHYYAARVPHLKQVDAREWRSPCPIHNRDRDSFTVEAATGQWFCHSACGRGGDIFDLEQVLNGSNFKAAKQEVLRLIGRAESVAPARQVENIYKYPDENGVLLFEV